jgi:hypothetical protein
MRIFNGTNSVLSLPLNGNQKLEVYPKSVSKEFMGSKDFLSMLITSFSCNEIALIVSGPYELSVCADIPTAVNYTVQTLDEAIIRFESRKKKSEPKVEEQPKPEDKCECGCEDCDCEAKEPIEENVGPEITEPEPETNSDEPSEVITEEPENELKLKPKRTRRKKAEEE